MLKSFPVVVAMSFVLALVGGANASILTEDFEATFPAWESGYLGTNTNLENYYTFNSSFGNTHRGNNPDGLWLDDGDGAYFGDVVQISFSPAFAATLTSLALDVAGFVPATIEIFDASGATLLSTPLTLTFGAFTDPGIYANYSASSSNGIGGFRFITTSQVEGNTSIDNVTVNQRDDGVVPEPASVFVWSLIALTIGCGSLATRRRRG
jgi:hypothetical protein